MTEKEEHIFVVVVLAEEIVDRIYFDFKTAESYIKRESPSRWYNPVLIAIPKTKYLEIEKKTGVFGAEPGRGYSISDYKTEEVVVGIPDEERGYGNAYREFVEKNKRKFGLT